mmetsp:Transcript_43464/g.114615  ORF Transcript_43464/g.114615 Transcript_43464/m.114615 type:complete len:290 (-) Transcript_43464:1507-2376(-)
MCGAQPFLRMDLIPLTQDVAKLVKERGAVVVVFESYLREIVQQCSADLPDPARRGGVVVTPLEDAKELHLQLGKNLGDQRTTLAAQGNVRRADPLQHLHLHHLSTQHQLLHLLVEQSKQVHHPLNDFSRQKLEVPTDLNVVCQQLHKRQNGGDNQENETVNAEAFFNLHLSDVLNTYLPNQFFQEVLVRQWYFRSFPTLLLHNTLNLCHSLLMEFLHDELRLVVQNDSQASSNVTVDLCANVFLATGLTPRYLVDAFVGKRQYMLPLPEFENLVLPLPCLQEHANFLKV